jgi:hypothetical protein
MFCRYGNSESLKGTFTRIRIQECDPYLLEIGGFAFKICGQLDASAVLGVAINLPKCSGWQCWNVGVDFEGALGGIL